MDYFQITLDYIEGRIKPYDYEAMLDHDDALYQWIQSIVPAGKTIRIINRLLLAPEDHPYDIRLVLKKYEAIDEGGPRGTLSYHYYIHDHIVSLVRNAFPSISMIVDTRPAMLHDLELFACPSYIGGREVAESCILAEVLGDIPVDWSESKRNREAKARIKKAFHIEGNKHPFWIQAPEWPMSNGVPMRYLKTEKTNSEYKRHHFQDVETGEVRIVEDFH